MVVFPGSDFLLVAFLQLAQSQASQGWYRQMEVCTYRVLSGFR